MAAEYDLLPRPSSNQEDKQLLYPRLVSKGTVTLQDVEKEIMNATTLSRADLQAVIIAIEDKMIEYMTKGYHFQLGNIGYFWGRLKGRPVENEKDIHAQSISFVNVNFRATTAFKKACRGELKKSETGFNKNRNISEDECKRRIVPYLEKNRSMSITDFCHITGLLRRQGKVMIDRLVDEGFIAFSGRNTHKIYFIRQS